MGHSRFLTACVVTMLDATCFSERKSALKNNYEISGYPRYFGIDIPFCVRLESNFKS